MSAHDDRNSAGETDKVSRDLVTGLAHHKAGRRDRAETYYRKVLRRAPNNVDALHLLGVIAHEHGRHKYAVQLISRALARSPKSADAHQNLGNALLALGCFDEAAASYRTAIALTPDAGLAHCNLSTLLNSRGAFEAALDSARRAVELMPELADAHLNCARALVGQHRFIEAESAFRGAFALQPDRAETLSDLGNVLSELKRFEEALAFHHQAIALRPDNAVMHFRLGMTLFYAGDPKGAEASCRHATSLGPDFAPAWRGLGQMLRVLGRFEEARACFQRAIELDPEQPVADAGLAAIGQRAVDEEQLQRLRNLLASPDRPTAVRSEAGFALGMLLDNADRYDEAFACFSAANALRRQQLAAAGEVFDLAALRRQVDGLIESCTPALYSVVEGDANQSEAPVFIVGMPRSGTSLIEQIAATHSRVSGAGELKDIGTIVETIQTHSRDRPAEQLNPDLARWLADGYVAKLQRLRSGKERVIDKMPDNILHLGVIAVLLPMSRIIFCRRDFRDTCLSCYFHRFDEPIPYTQDLVDCVLRALEIERLADHWRGVLPLRMLTIDYEALIADLEGESRRLIEFLGLDWEPSCLDFYKTERPVLTASAWQVRQPIYTRSVGRWRKYERHLGPLFEVLAKGSVTGEGARSVEAIGRGRFMP
jgi:tetratricopeptide (TPR) repeat protein